MSRYFGFLSDEPQVGIYYLVYALTRFLWAWKPAVKRGYVCNVHFWLMSPFWLKWSDLPDQNWEENSLAFCICDSSFRFAPPTPRTPHHHPPTTQYQPPTNHYPPPRRFPRQVALNLQEVLVPKVGKTCLGTIAQNLPSALPQAIFLRLLEIYSSSRYRGPESS